MAQPLNKDDAKRDDNDAHGYEDVDDEDGNCGGGNCSSAKHGGDGEHAAEHDAEHVGETDDGHTS